MKTQFYFSEKITQFILFAATFFCISQINTQQAFTTITGLKAYVYRPMDYAASPTKHNTELQFLRVFDEAVMLPVGKTSEDYFTVNFFLPSCLVEGHLPSRSKTIFLPNKYYYAFTQ